MLDPAPTGFTQSQRRPPGRYEADVSPRLERIRRVSLDKVVLAREVRAEAARARPGRSARRVARALPILLLLLRRDRRGVVPRRKPGAARPPLGGGRPDRGAGRPTPRSADPAVDDHLGEQLSRPEEPLRARDRRPPDRARAAAPFGLGPAAASPSLIKVANIQHLATPIRAQLAEARWRSSSPGVLHPTPAIGGEPRDQALAAIAELEGIDRGWYTGAIGWMDAAEDGEFCVGLRSALLRDREAHLFAGCGIVADSDPAAELQESELKFEALLPLLTG